VSALRRCSGPLWAIGALALLTHLDVLAQPAAGPTRVLVLHSYGQDLAPYSDLALVFRDELTQKFGEPVDLVEVSLVTAGAGESMEDAPFVDYLQALLVARTPDLVVPIGGIASSFAQRQRQRLFPDVPTLYVAVDDRTLERYALTDKDTVVASRLDVHGFVQNIVDVLPETAHVAVVVGSSPVEQFWKEELLREFQPFMNRIEFIWFDELTFEEMKQRAAELPPNSAILYAVLIIDAAGIPRPLTRGIQDIHAAANAPVFGSYASNIDRGVVGGRLVSDGELGRSAASVAIRVLHGESPGAIKTPPLRPGAPVYNWKELQRWGIQETSLPSGSDVRFREPTAWEQYRPYLAIGVAIVLLQSALIAGLFWQRIRRRRAERETASLSGRLLTVHENERRRVARELHDDVTQRLAALAIEATRIEGPHRMSGDEATRSIRDGLVKLSEDVHALSYRLHPSVIEDLGLVEALKAECERVTRSGAVTVQFTAKEIPKKLPQDTALCVFRVAQEALRNVVRHAGASSVEVSVARLDGGLQLAVSDNGTGFDPGRHADRPSLGLASIRERVNLLKGTVDIDSAQGRGTTVLAWVPLSVVAK
jgi:signal transduction histidine kinase